MVWVMFDSFHAAHFFLLFINVFYSAYVAYLANGAPDGTVPADMRAISCGWRSKGHLDFSTVPQILKKLWTYVAKS